jgi:hypothetical protein
MKHVNKFADFVKEKRGLWDNVWAKRKRGEKPAKPGDEDYPDDDAFDDATEGKIDENVSNSEILDLVDNIQALIQKIKAENKSKGSKLFTIAGPLVKELHSLMESVESNDDIIFENEIAQKRGENSAKMRDVQQKIKEIQQSISELKQDEVDPRKIMILQLGIQKETLKLQSLQVNDKILSIKAQME